MTIWTAGRADSPVTFSQGLPHPCRRWPRRFLLRWRQLQLLRSLAAAARRPLPSPALHNPGQGYLSSCCEWAAPLLTEQQLFFDLNIAPRADC